MHKTKPRLIGLLLAAGGSTRLGQPKQLIKLNGESLVLRAARLLLTQTPDVYVVIGADAAKVGQQLRGLPVRIVRNEGWQLGMGTSIARGMQKVAGQTNGVLIMQCDQFKIEQEDLQALVTLWKATPTFIATASFDDIQCPPVIIPEEYFAELQKLQGEKGAKDLLKNTTDIIHIDMPNAKQDLDTVTDLETFSLVQTKE